MFVADDWASGDRKSLTIDQSHRLVVLQFACSDLWTREVHEDGYGSPQLRCGCSRTLNVESLLLVRAVRHVDTNAVRACVEQLFDDFRLARSWSKCD